MKKNTRADRDGKHRAAFDKNRKKIYATQSVCGICGKPVDPKLKFPHPMSRCIDHIIPIARGGHPSDIANLQLAHFTCNRQKSDKLIGDENKASTAGGLVTEILSNRLLPHTIDWLKYRG